MRGVPNADSLWMGRCRWVAIGALDSKGNYKCLIAIILFNILIVQITSL